MLEVESLAKGTKGAIVMKRISIVVPVYCNAESLPELMNRIDYASECLLPSGIEFEIIFVDDGSTDNSVAVLQGITEGDKRVTLVTLSRNFGSVHCSKRGLQFVTGDAFIILAADLQDPPELIVDLAKAWLDGETFVICERSTREDPVTTKIFAWLFYRLIRIFIVPGFPLRGFDLALYDQKMLPTLRDSSKTTYTPILAFWMGFRPYVIPYARQIRRHGRSKWTFGKRFNALLDVFFGFSVKPLRLVTFAGVLVSGTAILYGVVVVVNALLGNVQSVGFATLVVLISFLSGLQMLTFGVVGEYLWRVVEQVNRRPESVVDRVFD